MKVQRQQQGFTLIELMIAIAIIGILSAIALPLYTDYIETAEQAVLTQTIDTMRLFQEDALLRTGNYVTGTWDPGGVKTLETDPNLGWIPRGDSGTVVYVVTSADTTSTYTVTATDSVNGRVVARTFP